MFLVILSFHWLTIHLLQKYIMLLKINFCNWKLLINHSHLYQNNHWIIYLLIYHFRNTQWNSRISSACWSSIPLIQYWNSTKKSKNRSCFWNCLKMDNWKFTYYHRNTYYYYYSIFTRIILNVFQSVYWWTDQTYHYYKLTSEKRWRIPQTTDDILSSQNSRLLWPLTLFHPAFDKVHQRFHAGL